MAADGRKLNHDHGNYQSWVLKGPISQFHESKRALADIQHNGTVTTVMARPMTNTFEIHIDTNYPKYVLDKSLPEGVTLHRG